MKYRRTATGMIFQGDEMRAAQQNQGERHGDRSWEAYAVQVDQEAQRFYEGLARVIHAAEEALRDRSLSAMGRAYFTRIAGEARKALGQESGMQLDGKGDVALGATSRSIN